jgi:hypothetical protein
MGDTITIKDNVYKFLAKSGFSDKQCIAIIKAIAKIGSKRTRIFATKQDVRDILNKFDLFHQEIEKLELRMLIKLGSLITVVISLVMTLKLAA